MKRSSSRVVSSAVVALALLAGCPASAEPVPSLPELAAAAGLDAYPAPLRAPPFRLAALDGKTATDGDFRGRVVLLSFWASWCPPCKVEFPTIETLQAAFPRESFLVVAIAVGDTPEGIARFLGDRPAPFPILLDPDRKTAGEYRAAGVPVAYILNREGRLVAGKSGAHDWDAPAVRTLIRNLVEQRGES